MTPTRTPTTAVSCSVITSSTKSLPNDGEKSNQPKRLLFFDWNAIMAVRFPWSAGVFSLVILSRSGIHKSIYTGLWPPRIVPAVLCLILVTLSFCLVYVETYFTLTNGKSSSSLIIKSLSPIPSTKTTLYVNNEVHSYKIKLYYFYACVYKSALWALTANCIATWCSVNDAYINKYIPFSLFYFVLLV